MGKVKIYSVVTIEGYASGPRGELDWLVDNPVPSGVNYGIADFYKSIGTVVMTRGFYSVMHDCELCHHFLDRKCIIVRNPIEGKVRGVTDAEYIPIDKDFSGAVERVRELLVTYPGDIWIAGDMGLVTAFFDAGLIDEVYLTTLPVSLPGGIRLFPASFLESDWSVSLVHDYGNGLRQLVYRNKAAADRFRVN